MGAAASATIAQIEQGFAACYTQAVKLVTPYAPGAPENAPFIVDVALFVSGLWLASQLAEPMRRLMLLLFFFGIFLAWRVLCLVLTGLLWILFLPVRIVQVLVWHAPVAVFWHTPKIVVRSVAQSLRRPRPQAAVEGSPQPDNEG